MTYKKASDLNRGDEVTLKGTREVCKVMQIQKFKKYKLVIVKLKTYTLDDIEVFHKDIYLL